MQNRYSITLKSFLKDKKFNSKSFIISANDNLVLDNDNIKVNLGIYFKLILSKKENDLHIKLSLYSWSNKKQILVPLEKSIWIDEDFGGGKYISKIEKNYKNIVENFLYIFKELKYLWQLKEIIHKLETPTFIFHYKLLNTFSKDILEAICLKHLKNYPNLNIPLLKNRIYPNYNDHIFLPDYIEGFYIYGLEISVDLNETDFAVIENDDGVISKDECLKLLGILEQ
jgi:hypothetical protein